MKRAAMHPGFMNGARRLASAAAESTAAGVDFKTHVSMGKNQVFADMPLDGGGLGRGLCTENKRERE
jgi:hypothetical protein